MKICEKCGLNYVLDENEDVCEVCKQEGNVRKVSSRDSNKTNVEVNLLPVLRSLPKNVIDALTEKRFSYELLHIRLPLLVECRCLGKERCKEEIIVDNSNVRRYYATPYVIHGKYYHICSQWWECKENDSKQVLKLFEQVKEKMKSRGELNEQ